MNENRATLRPVIAAVILAVSMPVGAQVFKCQEGGKTVYSQTPCGAAATVIDARPAAGAGDPEAAARTRERVDERRRAERASERNAVREDEDRARGEVRRIRAENYDPEKCAAARARIALAEKRDPIGFSYDPDVMEFKQMESLYCGGR